MDTRSGKTGRNGKNGKKQETPANPQPNPITEGFSEALEEIQAFIAAEFKHLEDKLLALENRLAQVCRSTEEPGGRLTSVESTLKDLKDRVSHLEDNNERLTARVVDLESRSRRQNLHIVGLAEDTETGTLTKFFSELLVTVFGDDMFPTPPELDRAHRSLLPKPKPGQKPRSVVICLHRYQTKELLIREARRKGTLQYQGKQFRIVEDYSPEVMKQRAVYREVMSELYKRGCKPSLLFPARLRISLPNGSKKWFGSVEEAREYTRNLPAPVTE